MTDYPIEDDDALPALNPKVVDVWQDDTMELYVTFYRWANEGKIDYLKGDKSEVIDHHIAKLLGFGDLREMIVRWGRMKKDLMPTIAALTGPHGWAIYQTMLARKK